MNFLVIKIAWIRYLFFHKRDQMVPFQEILEVPIRNQILILWPLIIVTFSWGQKGVTILRNVIILINVTISYWDFHDSYQYHLACLQTYSLSFHPFHAIILVNQDYFSFINNFNFFAFLIVFPDSQTFFGQKVIKFVDKFFPAVPAITDKNIFLSHFRQKLFLTDFLIR